MVAGLYVFKSLWVGMSKDWIAGAVIVLTALFTVVLPAAQLLLQSPSLYVGAMVFGALAIGVVREKIPATFESLELLEYSRGHLLEWQSCWASLRGVGNR